MTMTTHSHEHWTDKGVHFIINCHLDNVLASTRSTDLLAVAGDAVVDLVKAGQLLDVDMNRVSRIFTLAALDSRFGFQVTQPAQAQVVQDPGHGREGSVKQPCDVAQVQPLVPELHGPLQVMRIELQPLAAA